MNHLKFFISAVVICFSMTINAQSRYDVNGDGIVNVTDAVSVVNKILNGADDNGNTPAEAIDLGLPSGTKWASWNLGASSPEECGGRYAWGETEEKLVYSNETYLNYDRSTGKYRNIGNDISGTAYDAAHVKWGGLWHMPSQSEFEELVTFCTYEWTTYKGVKGGKFIGPNGNSIFLPINSSLDWDNIDVYWLGYDDGRDLISDSQVHLPNRLANCLKLYSDDSNTIHDYEDAFRSDGLMIRPVYSNTSKIKMVDLGLPSGIKWASCNVGASCPEEVGDKYAWGEIGTKLEYTWDNYLFFDSLKQVTEDGHINDEVVCHDIGNDISGTKYDVAHVKWGDSWRMPTDEDIKELVDCTFRRDLFVNGVGGVLLTGPNGNTIFFPQGDYWDSSISLGFSGTANGFSDSANGICMGDGYTYEYGYFFMTGETGRGDRYEGRHVRPVSKR